MATCSAAPLAEVVWSAHVLACVWGLVGRCGEETGVANWIALLRYGVVDGVEVVDEDDGVRVAHRHAAHLPLLPRHRDRLLHHAAVGVAGALRGDGAGTARHSVA